MADDLLPPIIAMVTFIGIATFMITALTTAVANHYSWMNTDQNIPDPYEDYDIKMDYTPADLNISSVTIYTDENGLTWDPSATFTYPDARSIHMWVVRNNTYHGWGLAPTDKEREEDYLYFRQDYGTFGFKHAHDLIPFRDIETNFDTTTNYSMVKLDLSHTYYLYVWHNISGAPSSGRIVQHLYNNHVNISIERFLNYSDLAKNKWALIGQVLTLDVPNIHPVIRLLIAIPFYISIAYIVLAILSRFMPTGAGL